LGESYSGIRMLVGLFMMLENTNGIEDMHVKRNVYGSLFGTIMSEKHE